MLSDYDIVTRNKYLSYYSEHDIPTLEMLLEEWEDTYNNPANDEDRNAFATWAYNAIEEELIKRGYYE